MQIKEKLCHNKNSKGEKLHHSQYDINSSRSLSFRQLVFRLFILKQERDFFSSLMGSFVPRRGNFTYTIRMGSGF